MPHMIPASSGKSSGHSNGRVERLPIKLWETLDMQLITVLSTRPEMEDNWGLSYRGVSQMRGTGERVVVGRDETYW